MNLSENGQWFDDLVLELRLRDIRGEVIGDTAAAVRSHCDDSGETPAQAFGDPREYARSLEFGEQDVADTSPREWGRVFAPVVVGLAGFTLTIAAVTAAAKGLPVDLAWGSLASAAVLAVVALFSARHLAMLLDRPMAAMLIVGGGVAMMTMLPILWPSPAFSMSVPVAVAVGVVLLAASVVLGRRTGSLGDPVVDPLTYEDRYASSDRSSWRRLVTGEWVFVTWTVLVGLVLWGLLAVLP